MIGAWRAHRQGKQVVCRRRECPRCGGRYTSVERVDPRSTDAFVRRREEILGWIGSERASD